MAAIDKIYVQGWDNYCKFRDWVEAQPELEDKYGKKVKLIDYLRKFKDEKEWAWEDGADPELETHPVMNNPYFIDAYIIRNCPLEFVQYELQVNYGYWSQERIKDFYDQIKEWDGDGECPYWAKLEDFIFNEDGTITLKGLTKSDYEMILDNELYTKPYREGVEYGKHFRMAKSPNDYGYPNFNRPMKGTWFVNIVFPEASSCDYMWHHRGKSFFSAGTWDFCDEFVDSNGASSCAYAKTITALKRYIRKWRLPIGAKVVATGRYEVEHYEFIITK